MKITVNSYNPGTLSQQNPYLSENAIAVWYSYVPENTAIQEQFQTLLSAEERQRALFFRFHSDRKRFIHAHGLLRVLIGHYLNTAPKNIVFFRQKDGKPALDIALYQSGVTFSLSSSHDMVACALALRLKVGIDIEYCGGQWDFQSLVSNLFHEEEIRALDTIPDSERRNTFFDVWTRKEAFLKGTGEGLNRVLDSFCVYPAPGAVVLEKDGHGISVPGPWRVHSFRLHGSYAAAVAFREPKQLSY